MTQKSSRAFVSVDKHLLNKLMRETENSNWPYLVTLSCDIFGKVFDAQNKGFHEKVKRHYLSFKDYPFLKEIVERLLIVSPEAGRFHICNDVVVLARNHDIIVCKINPLLFVVILRIHIEIAIVPMTPGIGSTLNDSRKGNKLLF